MNTLQLDIDGFIGNWGYSSAHAERQLTFSPPKQILTMDISELIIAFGACYEQAGQNVTRIVQPFQQGWTPIAVNLRVISATKARLTTMAITPSWLLQVGVDVSTINSVNIGPLDKNSIFDQVEAFIDGQHDQV